MYFYESSIDPTGLAINQESRINQESLIKMPLYDDLLLVYCVPHEKMNRLSPLSPTHQRHFLSIRVPNVPTRLCLKQHPPIYGPGTPLFTGQARPCQSSFWSRDKHHVQCPQMCAAVGKHSKSTIKSKKLLGRAKIMLRYIPFRQDKGKADLR